MGTTKRLAPPALAVALLALALPATALASQTLTVEKAGGGTGTVASFPSGINCGPTCQASFADNASVSLTAATGANTLPVQWTGCDSVNGESKCIVAMSGPRTVKATFNLIQVGLSVTKNGSGTGTVTSSPAGIECGSSCSASFGKGSTVTLTGAPGPKAEAVQWSGCDSVNGEDKCLVTMSAAKSVTATFNLGSELSVSRLGTGTGTVSSTPAGIECGTTCAATFAKGQKVTLKATPGLHTMPVKWLGCESEPAGGCEVTMSSAREVTALFALEPQWVQYTITLAKVGTGKGTVTSAPSGIECGEDCSASYVLNTSLTLFATPAPGSEFDHWSITACGTSPVCTTTVKSSRQVNAVFAAVGRRRLTVSKAGSGQGTVTSKPAGIECGSACSAELDASTKVVLKAKAAKGSKFKGFVGEGCAATKTCRVQMNEAQNVTATFEKLPAPPPAAARLKILSGRAKGKRIQLTVQCFGESACQGTISLIAKVRSAKGKVKGLLFAKLPYNLTAGSTQTLAAKLKGRAFAQLRSQGHLSIRIGGQGVESRTVSLTTKR